MYAGALLDGYIQIQKRPSKSLPVQYQQRHTGKTCEICSKLTMKTSERRQ